MTRRILTATLTLLALTQAACLQSVLTPAHRLDGGEVVAGAAIEASVTPRVSASATFGLGEGDASVYATGGAFGGDFSEGLFAGGGITARWYTPIGGALGGGVDYARGVNGVLADGNTPQIAQALVKFVSIPDESFWLYGGPTVTAPLTAFDGSPLGDDRLVFFGFVAGLNIPTSATTHAQIEFIARPLAYQDIEGETRFGLLADDDEGISPLPLLFFGSQLNVGLNVHVASF